jgi:serine protease Do
MKFLNVPRAGLLSLLLLVVAFGITPSTYAQGRRSQSGVWLDSGSSSYLGIQMEDVTAGNMVQYKLSSERGVIVKSVESGSPAKAAGLQENDVILEYAGTAVFSAAQFTRLVQETPPGRKVDIAVSRDGKKVTLAADIGRREGALTFGRNSGPGGLEFFGPEGGRMFQFRIPEGGGFQAAPRVFDSGGPQLGVTLEPLTDQMAEFLGVPGKKGALVTSVEQGAPAAAKLKAGDVIIRADGKSIDDPDNLARIVRNKEDGKIDLGIIRDKKELSLSVDLKGGKKGGYRL